MDFNKFSEAGRNIKLTENKKREIVNACRNCGIDRHKPVSPYFKRTVAAICALTIVLMAGVVLTKHIGNGRQIPVGETDTSTVFSESTVSDIAHSEKSNETTSDNLIISKNAQTEEFTKNSQESIDAGGAFLTTRKYRVRYYSVPYQFKLLVGEEAYQEFENQTDKTTDELNEMKIKRFIQYFNISREDFDKTNLEFAKVLKGNLDINLMMNPKDYADQEIEEIFNADIIYTFDDEIINEYYLSPNYMFGIQIEYLEALENGTYQTRTTDWIDIEQMEAEIIAKYGETEIIPETATLPEETTV